MSFCVFVGIAWAFKGHGLSGVSALLGYIATLILVQLTMKSVLKFFPYPMFMSCAHFTFSFMAVLIYFGVTGKERPRSDIQCAKFRTWCLWSLLPPVLSGYGSIVLNNSSLLYIGPGLNGLISLATPVVTSLIAAACGLNISTFAWIGIALVLGGDALITVDSLKVSMADGSNVQLFLRGILLCVLALICRGAKTVLLDKLMNKYGSEEEEEEKKLTPLQLWYFQGPLLVSLGIAGTLLREGIAPLQELPAAFAMWYVLIPNIGSAVALNILAMYVIKMLGAPAAQIAGKFHVLVVVALSFALFGERVTIMQGVATLFILGGAFVFEKAQEKKIDDVKNLLAAFQREKDPATV